MPSSYIPIISILGLSIIVQASAAIMAIRLIGITGRRVAWGLIAAALVLMAVRRIVPLYRLITGDIAHPPDVVNEVIGLALSTSMAIGISLIAPLFHERKRAEEMAKEVAAEWLTTFNSTSDLFFLIDKDYRITRANKAAAAFLALPLEDIVGHHCYALVHGTTYPLPECPLSRLQQSMKHEEAELYLMAQDIWVQVTVDPIIDEKGELLGAVHIVRDITQRKRAEEKLRQSEERHRAILQTAMDGFWLVDLQGRLQEVNETYCRMSGYSAQELLGMRIPDLEATETADETTARIQRIMAQGEDRFESRHCRKDGSCYDVEISVQSRPADGGQMVVFLRDITERKRAEEALHRLNRELQAIRNCDQILMRATDEQTLLGDICRIVCDKAGYRMAWVGYAELDDTRSVRSVTWAGIEDGYLANANITWDDSERGCGPTGTAIRTGESACIQDFTTDPHASPWRESALQRGYRSSIALPLKDEGQNTFGVLSIYSTEPNAFTTDEKRLLEELAGDLEFGIMVLRTRIERKRAEESLARLNEELEQRVRDRTLLLQQRSEELELANERLKEVDGLKSRFIASMSHELRTPLNAIIGFSSILHDEWPGRVNAEQKQNLASILNSGRHLLDMINDILDVTQIEGGTVTPVVEAFDLYDLLAEAESRVTAAVREKGLELRCEPLRQRMRTDRRRLLQCLLNLLGNAAKFTDKGGVTLEARIVSSPGEEEMVEIAVTDTGIGIGEADLARIFLPFSRIVIPGRTIVPGTGLGLFLSRKISTELLKGDLHVSSEYGRGSRFSLRIPVRLP